VLKTDGNLNNHIGVPQTLLRLTARHEAAVIEMGISRLGEMARLCEIAEPTHGVLTNIGPTHLEALGDLRTVAQAEGEVLERLRRGRRGASAEARAERALVGSARLPCAPRCAGGGG